jgi:superfamily II DNA or RNA helicase
VRAVAESERLTFGYLFNPTFATEISIIDTLPHQRVAVYDHMMPQTRLRFLLADDAGAGKTIMTGLYVREMLTRRLIRRVLIVPPAGLVGNWEQELRTRFNLSFTIIGGAEARATNPFVGSESNLLIVSLDTLAGARMFSRLQEAEVEPYDLVVFDEAHKLSADRQPDLTIRKTDRYRVAESLSGVYTDEPRWSLNWNAHHLLLLTATPHMGKDFPYYCLWRLLEPEILATKDAFDTYPSQVRRNHFLRRTKEEMIYWDGTALFKTRVSNTLGYELSPGEISEQHLYDETTAYIRTFYNRARILNRSAARFAMNVFQRRLASSTFALLQSFERRLEKIKRLITNVETGKVTLENIVAAQKRLDQRRSPLDDMTADEEAPINGQEENEVVDDELLGGVVAASLNELKVEREELEKLVILAHQVYDKGEESKFDRLREVLMDPSFQHEKMIIFTEHRDTMSYLVRRLEGLGFTGKIAQIHGAMDYLERQDQVEFFKRSEALGGASYLVATDAAGEGINLQFCWIMINYDIPWNPARLEQRMGRIHRYLQKHDPVLISNLVATKTREGRVLSVLLEKLERIRRELGSDKVYDVIGRLFEGVSLREYMERAVTDEGAKRVAKEIEGKLSKEQVEALQQNERRLFGDGGDVKPQLSEQLRQVKHEEYLKLLPGYVRRLLESALPLLDLASVGDLNSVFAIRGLRPTALDPLLPVLERYPAAMREKFSVHNMKNTEEAIFLRPGEPVFDQICSLVTTRFGSQALRGGSFVDPYAQKPYLFHLALVSLRRKADPTLPALCRDEILDYRLIGLRQWEKQTTEQCPVEHLLLLRGLDKETPSGSHLVMEADSARDNARRYLSNVVLRQLVEDYRKAMLADISAREESIAKGYDYHAAELAQARTRLLERANAGDAKAGAELARIREQQRELAERKQLAISTLRREPELIEIGEVSFITHALGLSSQDEEDRKRHDAAVEAIAMQVAISFEESLGSKVHDVSTPPKARIAGLTDCPGFDLLSLRTDGSRIAIEVKGRAEHGAVEVTDNEWSKALNLRNQYWLYVVYKSATPHPDLWRVQDPFGNLLASPKGGVIIGEGSITGVGKREL